ncbi:hypothetical protein D1871_19050 [Nakamurella silvestris]|nr:hypothetical protein D1871_19050 [Nakamurella silvestris]
MSAYEGPAVLRAMVNRSTGIDCNVNALVTETGNGWEVIVAADTPDDHLGVGVFGNPWLLIFPDGSSFDVQVQADDSGNWTVTEIGGS